MKTIDQIASRLKAGSKNRTRKLEQILRRMMRRNQALKPVGHWLVGKRHQAHLEIAQSRVRLGEMIAGGVTFQRSSTVNPENIIWIFGMGRSGNTWLLGMMRDFTNHLTWDEPFVGKLFGEFYNSATVARLSRSNFIMGEPVRKGWIQSIRDFVLSGAKYSHPRLKPEDYLVVGEHNGSEGAPLLVEALPESRVILLLRDPRDVVASIVDGARKGGWLYESQEKKSTPEEDTLAEMEPDAFVRQNAERYLREVGYAKQAYDSHKGRKVLVKYEELRSDTSGTLLHIYSKLKVPVDVEEIRRVAEAHSWENIPAKDKGSGKFTRKATPGGWKEDLSPEQVRIVEETTAPLLEEFYRT